MTRERRVAVIGAGVAGLTAAVLLARRGVRVSLFEARDEIGGCCSSTTIDGFTFHDGAVYVAIPALLDAAFARIGLERLTVLPLRPVRSPYAATVGDGTTVATGPSHISIVRRDGTTTTIDGEVERFVSRWRPLRTALVGDLLQRPFSWWSLVSKAWRDVPKLRLTFAEELARSFSDEAARSALAGWMLYAGVTADRLPAVASVGLASMLGVNLAMLSGAIAAEALLQDLAGGGRRHSRPSSVGGVAR